MTETVVEMQYDANKVNLKRNTVLTVYSVLQYDAKKVNLSLKDLQQAPYNLIQAPLGKLTKDQIRLGYEALKVIEESVVKGKAGSKQHIDACNQFYTR